MVSKNYPARVNMLKRLDLIKITAAKARALKLIDRLVHLSHVQENILRPIFHSRELEIEKRSQIKKRDFMG